MFLLIGLLACGHPLDTRPFPDDTAGDTGTVQGTDTQGTDTQGTDTGPVSGFALSADDDVALPFATAGDPVPDGTLTVRDHGDVDGTGKLAVSLIGPFDVTGDLGALSAGEVRSLTVSYTGSIAAPALVSGTATLTEDGQSVTVALGAVLGDVDLPDTTWTTDAWETCTEAEFPSAPYPATDGSVIVCVPPGYVDDDGVDVITHLHGFNAVIAKTVVDQALIEQASLSGRNAVFVMPQGP